MKWFRYSQRLYRVCHCVVWSNKLHRQPTPSGSRKHFSDIRRQEYYHLFRQRSRELRVAATRTRRLGNVSGWRTSFRRTIFVVQTKILYCGPTNTHKVSFWRLKWSQLLRQFVSQNKAKNAGRSRKNAGMREIHQNAGFPTRLRDGWHLCIL